MAFRGAGDAEERHRGRSLQATPVGRIANPSVNHGRISNPSYVLHPSIQENNDATTNSACGVAPGFRSHNGASGGGVEDHRSRGETGETGRRFCLHGRSGLRRSGKRLLHRPAQRPHSQVERRGQALYFPDALRAVQRALLRRPGQPLGLRRPAQPALVDRSGRQGDSGGQAVPGQAAQRAQRRLAPAGRRTVLHRSLLPAALLEARAEGAGGRRSTTSRRTARSSPS